MKILVIFTGGTIGSEMTDGYITPDASKKKLIINNYTEIYGNDAEFASLEAADILSENADCVFIKNIVDCVWHNKDGYDGIVITHGSDTIQYTAAALSFTCGELDIPVMVVCSNYILTDNRANGNENFAAAVEFIKRKMGVGVYVPYANEKGRVTIHRGHMLMPHNMYSDSLFSLDNKIFGIFEDGIFIKSEDENVRLTQYEFVENNSNLSQILWINPYPGQDFAYSPDRYKAVLISSYHSGTICTASPSLLAMTKEAEKKNIPVYLVGNSNTTDYESCKMYETMGIKVLPKMSPITAYVEIWLKAACNPVQKAHGTYLP